MENDNSIFSPYYVMFKIFQENTPRNLSNSILPSKVLVTYYEYISVVAWHGLSNFISVKNSSVFWREE